MYVKPCQHCGKQLPPFHQSILKKRKFCSQACWAADFRKPENIERRFWAKVKKAEGDACWIWRGARSVSKYGTANYKGTNMNAHRVAWIITHGHELPAPGVDVLHTCANGIGGCVRPDHLYLGTDKENAVDRILQGSGSKFVTVEQVRKIKKLLAERPYVRGVLAEIAEEVGVEPRVVYGIRAGKNWWHVQ